MRKYHQLLLLLTSIVSVALLLIYRHEYNRLRYVLEVFNFFGQPNDCTFPELANITTPLQHDWGPTPFWTSEENFAMYSAFMKTENDIEALVVREDNNNAIQTCILWFETNLKPVTGKVNYSKITILNEDNNLAFYKYNCRVDSVAEAPYAVSFHNDNKVSKKILIPPKAKKKYEFTTVCVVPSEEYSKQQIVEFISFHKIIGIDSFLIYNNNIPYKFMHLLQKLSIKLGVQIINFPWNYPYRSTEQIRSIVEEDCVLRTKDTSKNVLTLDFKEFVVPKHHFSLSSLLDSYDPSDKTNRFGLSVLLFCTNDNNPIYRAREPSMLQNVYYDATNTPEYLYVHRSNVAQSNSVVNTHEISETVGAIHRYSSCKSKQKNMDSSMVRFVKDIRKSTLFKLFKYDRL